MANYGLKYWWTKNRGGKTVRLEIRQRDYTGASKEIYALTALSIDMQGGQDSIDSAIIKTSLNVNIIDCSDIADTSTMKYGDWTEFFTPDSTLYKFIVYQDGSARWSGYLTPDSYEEDLSFRNTISLTARDNIGHLADFVFDYTSDTEMISLNTLIDSALAKIDFPMLTMDVTPSLCFVADGSSVLNYVGSICFNVSAFKDMTWYDALNSALDSLGLVLRYVDYNSIVIATMRQITQEGEIYSGRKSVQFIDVSGHRMLDPAYKEIRETLDYVTSDNVYAGELEEGSFGSDEYYVFGYYNFDRPAIQMPVNRITSGKEWSNYNQNGDIPASFNPYKYSVSDDKDKWIDIDDGTVYFPVDIGSLGDPSVYTSYDPLLYKKNLNAGKFTFSMRVEGAVSLYDDNSVIGMTDSVFNFTNIMFSAIWRGTGDLYYDGTSWVELTPETASTYISKAQSDSSFTVELPSPDDPGSGYLEFRILDIGVLYGLTEVGEGNGLYARITEVAISSDISMQSSGFNVTTKYNESNNVMLERSPKFGQVNFSVISPAEIVNGLYFKGSGDAYYPVTKWKWRDLDEFQASALPVLVHTQILAFHAKPDNVLTGTLRDSDDEDPHFSDIWVFDGKPHLIVSGSLDLLTGYVESAILREYQSYDSIWLSALEYYLLAESGEYMTDESGNIYVINIKYD